MDGYFRKLPRFVYDGREAVDITRRVVITEAMKKHGSSWHPYTVRAGMRADHIASQYYNDPDRAWLVWLSAGIIDPYYGWYMDRDTFERFVVLKYGSIEAAKQLVLHWQLVWAGIEEEVTPEAWATTVPSVLKKYYDANYGPGSRIMSYRRRREDWKRTTNQILDIDHIELTGDRFELGERVSFHTGNTVLGNAVVAWSNTTVLRVQHVFGEANTGYTVTGEASNVAVTVADRDHVANTLSVEERVYWEPVYAWEHERDRNENMKVVRLLDSKYADEVSTTLRKRLQAKV